MQKGKLVVIEGSCDGVGKSTQQFLLGKRLKEEGYNIINHHFPSYETDQAKPVELYLSGHFGKPSEVSPYLVNSLYAIDRAITWLKELREEYLKGHIILLDRYTTSSLIYQSANITDINEKKAFVDYVCDFEYNKLGIAEPDKVIYLHMPYELSKILRHRRENNAGIQNDVHEIDDEFMKRVYENSLFMSDYLKWDRVECSDKEEMKSMEEIHEKVYKLAKK